jgi:hypothetical protein
MGVDTNCSKSNPEWLWINLKALAGSQQLQGSQFSPRLSKHALD